MAFSSRRVGFGMLLSAHATVYVLIALALHTAPWFDWPEHALSDLGVVSPSLYFFNTGLVACGLMSITAAVILLRFQGSTAVKTCHLTFIASGVFLAGVGVVTEDFGPIHFMIAVGFFVTVMAFAMILAVVLHHEERRIWPLPLASVGVSLFVWTLPFGGIAIPEIVSVLLYSLWVFVFSYLEMVKDRR